jgi:hypothetical protein
MGKYGIRYSVFSNYITVYNKFYKYLCVFYDVGADEKVAWKIAHNNCSGICGDLNGLDYAAIIVVYS